MDRYQASLKITLLGWPHLEKSRWEERKAQLYHLFELVVGDRRWLDEIDIDYGETSGRWLLNRVTITFPTPEKQKQKKGPVTAGSGQTVDTLRVRRHLKGPLTSLGSVNTLRVRRHLKGPPTP